jgi:hypothetical protein
MMIEGDNEMDEDAVGCVGGGGDGSVVRGGWLWDMGWSWFDGSGSSRLHFV